MKINIEANKFNYREGFTNVSQAPDDPRIAPALPYELNSVCQDSEAELIVANFVLAKLDHNILPWTVAHWNKKLKQLGKLAISFFDIRQICAQGYCGAFSLEQIHNSIFGENNENKSIIDIDTIKKVLPDLGFKITSITSKDTIVVIEAVKIGEVEIE
jgi:hypothetical protein